MPDSLGSLPFGYGCWLALSLAWLIPLLRDWPQLLVGEDKVNDMMPHALQDIRSKLINLSALHYGTVSPNGEAREVRC